MKKNQEYPCTATAKKTQKPLNPEYLSASSTKEAMETVIGREISKVQAFTIVVSQQSGKTLRKDLIQPHVPVKVWAEVNDTQFFAVRPLLKETGKKAKVEIIDKANVISMTPLAEFEYAGKHYLRQRVNDNHRFGPIRKR